ncbi:hypothetical protein [Shinella sp. DD12]|uniref:hypothetical protein n=1 Tax=Shinella sp. DD12 TaxID=1410620 RepID=UPI000437979A|nr:hypothetical protein [Shinella sp. DD12]EYR84265.1 hypothetical protein SHLA_14c000470 [Shinella sp. DD12]
MPKTDAFGVLILDESDDTPIQAWAIPRLGMIDPSLVFLRREDARTRAVLELDGVDAVVPVVVTGSNIEIIRQS